MLTNLPIYKLLQGLFVENVIEGNLDGVVLREGGCPTLERNTITGQTRRGLLVCARGQGTVTDNEISDNLDANVEVRGELEKFVPEEQAHTKDIVSSRTIVSSPSHGEEAARVRLDYSLN